MGVIGCFEIISSFMCVFVTYIVGTNLNLNTGVTMNESKSSSSAVNIIFSDGLPGYPHSNHLIEISMVGDIDESLRNYQYQ